MDDSLRDTKTEASSPQLARVLPELIETLQRLMDAQERPSIDSAQSVSQRLQRGPLDLVGKALDEEFHGEQLKNIPKWAEVQTLSLETIAEENDAYLAKYEGKAARIKNSCLSHIVLPCANILLPWLRTEFWKGLGGTAAEIETTNKAYQSAFDVSRIYITAWGGERMKTSR